MPTNDYSKNIVYLSKEQYQELITNETLTVNGQTITYNDNDIYVTPQAEPVTDVKINGTSIKSGETANIPVASSSTFGTVKVGNGLMINSTNVGQLDIRPTPPFIIKTGETESAAITVSTQHASVFYGLAKASGDTTQSQSSNAVGQYTDGAKASIQRMLGVTDLIAAEESSTATAAHAINSTFMMDGKLYRATSAIAIGDAVVEGQNCEVVKIEDAYATKKDTVLETTLSRGRRTIGEIGDSSIGFGEKVIASGQYSVAFGDKTISTGKASFSGGSNVIDTGNYTYGYGAGSYGNLAKLNGADEAITYTCTQGLNKLYVGMAIRYGSNVATIINLDENNNTITVDKTLGLIENDYIFYHDFNIHGSCSFGTGNNIITYASMQSAYGKNNVVDINGIYATIIGNGTSKDARSNAYALDWNGNGHFMGDVYVGANADSSGGTKLARLSDVQVNGTSILNNGIANIPYTSDANYGVMKTNPTFGIGSINGFAMIAAATIDNIKPGSNGNKPIVPLHQHESTFYGLAKAAGDTSQASSNNAVGTYTAGAKTAIKQMIGINVEDVQVNSTSVVSNGIANINLSNYATTTDTTAMDARITALEAEITSLRQALQSMLTPANAILTENNDVLTDEQGNPIESDVSSGG